MQVDFGLPISLLRVDGGASASNLLMQIESDVLDFAVVCPENTEATAMGAAYLAAIGVGYWENAEPISEQSQMDRVFEPSVNDAERARIRSTFRSTWYRDLIRTGEWEMPE
jgi:glycerol kinase